MMERKGGCCLAPRYGAAWQMGDIMRKFRPIAPKPAAMAPAPATAAAAGNGKRKALAAGAGSGRRGRKTKKAAPTTLVAPPVEDKKPLSSSPSSSSTSVTDSSTPPPPQATLTHAPTVAPTAYLPPARVAGALQALRPVASCVTLESVTGTWGDDEAPAAAACGGDDDAPAFVSDRWGRVTWMNLAFNRAMSGDAGVVLAAKDCAAMPAWGTCAGFTCRVRVTYVCPRRGSLVAPCDVWRLEDGGYLWRLDLQATLTLSLGGLL